MVDPALLRLLKSVKDDAQPKIAFDAARDILDRNGLDAIERVEISGELSVAEILRARRQRREVIDVMPVIESAKVPE